MILNPSAQSEKAMRSAELIGQLSDRIEVVESFSFEQARELAKGAVDEGRAAVVAAGGDGTVNAVISGLVGSQTTLGVFPTGTMNLFARELDLPMNDLAACWGVIEAGTTRDVDLFAANGQVFVQLAGVGFDAKIIEETSWERKKKFGPMSYVLSAFSVAGSEPPPLRVIPETGDPVVGAFALIGNGGLYGPAYKVFRRASNTDGLLDVIVFEKQGRIDILKYLSGIGLGRVEAMRGVTYLQSRSLRFECDQAVPVEIDGELAGTTPVEFSPTGQHLRVFAPPLVEAG
ncbi:MAG: diacylglycerol/lipid kinase family protein [Verrucomicrobiales bacterium]